MDTWENITEWHYVLPPSRPSQYHLGVLRDSAELISRSAPVAVLGSTPEIRDLLCEMGFNNIFVFEKNRSTFGQMNQLRSYSNHENVIWGDWLSSLENYTGTFNLIASDLTSGNIPYELQQRFYELISRSLSPGGVFYDKLLQQSERKRPVNSLLEKYTRIPINLLSVNYFSCELFFCSELLSLKDLVDSSLFYEILGKTESPVIKKYLEECRKITPANCIWYYGKPWKDLEKEYFSNLKREAYLDDELNSPYFGNLKIILSKKL